MDIARTGQLRYKIVTDRYKEGNNRILIKFRHSVHWNKIKTN